MASKYDPDKVLGLIQAAAGTARILNLMADSAENEDFALAQAYNVLFNTLWYAVEGVTGQNPMALGAARRHDYANAEEA